MKNVIYVFMALFLGTNIFADSLIVRNPREHTNTVQIYKAHDDNHRQLIHIWTLKKGDKKLMRLGHDVYLQLVILNKDKMGMCQVHLQE